PTDQRLEPTVVDAAVDERDDIRERGPAARSSDRWILDGDAQRQRVAKWLAAFALLIFDLTTPQQLQQILLEARRRHPRRGLGARRLPGPAPSTTRGDRPQPWTNTRRRQARRESVLGGRIFAGLLEPSRRQRGQRFELAIFRATQLG